MMKSRVVRVDDALWAAAGERAALLGFSRAEFIRRCIQNGINETQAAAPLGGAAGWYLPPGGVVEDENGAPTISAEWVRLHAISLNHTIGEGE